MGGKARGWHAQNVGASYGSAEGRNLGGGERTRGVKRVEPRRERKRKKLIKKKGEREKEGKELGEMNE